MSELLVKPRLKKSGNGLKASWYVASDGCDISTRELFEEKRSGCQIDLDLSYDGKYLKQFKESLPSLLLNLIESFEKCDLNISQDLTRRILLNGGLSEYVKKLENKNQEAAGCAL